MIGYAGTGLCQKVVAKNDDEIKLCFLYFDLERK